MEDKNKKSVSGNLVIYTNLVCENTQCKNKKIITKQYPAPGIPFDEYIYDSVKLICADCGNKYKDNPVFGVNPDSVTYDHSKEMRNKKEDKTETKELWKIFVSEQDIQFALGTIYREAEYDRTSIDQIFLGMMSAATNKPIGHTVNSRKAGVGKSYLLNKVASYFPDKYVRTLAGASNKAFLHNEGTMVLKSENGDYVPIEPIISEIEAEISELNAEIESEKTKESKDKDNELIRKNKKIIQEKANEIKKLISSQCKLIDFGHIPIILAQDTFQDEFFQTLLSLISQDSERDQEYTFVEQSGSGKFGARTNILTGTPVIFTTRVTDDTENKRFAEKNRRFINVTPNTSEAKNKAAIELMFKKYGSTPEEYDAQVVSRDNKKRAKKII